MLNVAAVSFEIPLEFCQSQVMRFQREQPHPVAWIQRYQAARVICRRGGNGDKVQVDAVFAVQL